MTASHFQAAGSSTAVFDISEPLDVLTVRGATIDIVKILGASGSALTSWDDDS